MSHTGNKFDQNPCFERSQGMVVDVQPGDLRFLFATHKEYCVHELAQLGDVVYVTEVQHLRNWGNICWNECTIKYVGKTKDLSDEIKFIQASLYFVYLILPENCYWSTFVYDRPIPILMSFIQAHQITPAHIYTLRKHHKLLRNLQITQTLSNGANHRIPFAFEHIGIWFKNNIIYQNQKRHKAEPGRDDSIDKHI